MTAIGDLLDQLDADDLERLAERLAPLLAGRQQQATAAYTTSSLAAELRRSERSIRAAIGRGELAAVKRGRGWLISAQAVADWTQGPRPAVKGLPPQRTRPVAGQGVARRALARNP